MDMRELADTFTRTHEELKREVVKQTGAVGDFDSRLREIEQKMSRRNRSHPPSRNEAIGCVLGCFGAGA